MSFVFKIVLITMYKSNSEMIPCKGFEVSVWDDDDDNSNNLMRKAITNDKGYFEIWNACGWGTTVRLPIRICIFAVMEAMREH